MGGQVRRLWRVLAEPRSSIPPSQRLAARLLQRLLVVLVPVYLVMGVAALATRDRPLTFREALVGFLIFAAAVSAYACGRSGRTRLGAILVSSTGLAGGLSVALLEQDPVRAVTSVLFVLTGVVYASLLLSSREATVFGVVAIVECLVLGIVHPSVPPTLLVLPVFLTIIVSSLLVMGARLRERHLAEIQRHSREHQQSLERLRATLDSSLDAVVTCGPDRRIVDWSRTATELFGWSRDEAFGCDVIDHLFPEDERPAVRELLVLAGTDANRRAEFRAHDRKGRSFPADLSLSPIDFGGRSGVCLFLRDLTPRRRMESDLVQNDRMVTVGRLAAGVAHEINNPLTYVVTNLQLIEEQLLNPRLSAAELRDSVADALAGAARVQAIVRDLRTYVRGDDDPRHPVDLRLVLDSAVQIAWNELRHRARVVKSYGDIPFVIASEGRLNQVFVNLIVNAAQALPENDPENQCVELSTSVGAGGRVVIRIRDTGPGIPAEIRERLFSPFFTTKPVGEGTGLGLYVSRNIVLDHGGEVEIESTVGTGTTFIVSFPAAQPLPERSGAIVPSPPEAPSKLGQQLRILIVDDDAGIATALRRCLPEHVVTVVAGGSDALVAAASQRFDLVLCDVMMPGMTGVEVRARLSSECALDADRVVLMTGGAFTPGERKAFESSGRRLDKPIDLKQLQRLIHEISLETAAAPERVKPIVLSGA